MSLESAARALLNDHDSNVADLESIGKRVTRWPEMEALRAELAEARKDRGDARQLLQNAIDVLYRHGFVRCDIAACNCGSWHPRYGLPERMQDIVQALESAGHALDNSNGNLPLNALAQLVDERDRLRAQLERAMRVIDAALKFDTAEGEQEIRWTSLDLAIALERWKEAGR